MYHNTTGVSIYANGIWHYSVANNTYTKMGDSGTTTQTCPANGAFPGDRHPIGLMPYDSTRRVMWLHGGVCQGTVRTDLYRYNLNSNPASSTWTQMTNPSTNPADSRYNVTVYIPIIDALLTHGYDGGAGTRNTYIYCFTDRNPTSGVLTSAQTTAGCAADNWAEIAETVVGTNATAAGHWMHWNPVTRKVYLFDNRTNLEVHSYDPFTKTWTELNPSGKPGAAPTSSPVNNYPAVTYIGKTGKYLYHYVNGSTADYEFDPVAVTWTSLGDRGGGQRVMSIVYDPDENKVFSFGTSSGGAIQLYTIALSAATPTGGTVSIKNPGSKDVRDWPLQMGRAFAQGDIPNYPRLVECATQACANWEVVATQADVKVRHSDSSVKHAVISALIPVIPTGETRYFKFIDGSANNTALSKSDMLSATYNFGADINTSIGNTSARTMLNATTSIPDCESVDWSTVSGVTACYWLKGPINTQVVIADHSTAKAYDFGTSSALRPIFHASFWPGLGQVRVRYIVENANSEGVLDQSYNITSLTIGNTSPSTKYSKSGVAHHGLSAWTKTYWSGTAPTEQIDIGYDVAYLASTRAIPNYNTSITVNSSKITSTYSAWGSVAKDIFDGGHWTKAMGSGGGRPDIGPMPSWHSRWLFTGDYRMREVALGMAELASAWPAIIRENDSGKSIASGVNGLGRPVGIWSRPTTSYLSGYSYASTAAADRIEFLAATNTNGWNMEEAHTPAPWYISYLLTGDYYYLDTGLMWAFWRAHCANGAAANSQSYGRGPTGKEGVINLDQIRGIAWTLRDWAEWAWIAPTAMPEKAVVTQWIADAIAADEGARNITTTAYNGNAVWTFGRNFRSTNSQETLSGAYPALGQWRRGSSAFAQAEYGVNPSSASDAISLFEQSFLTYALGRGRELGFATDALLNWVGPAYIGAIGYDRWILNGGRLPTVASGSYISSWANVESTFYATTSACTTAGGCPYFGAYHVQDQSSFWKSSGIASGDPSYDVFATVATGMVAHQAGGWAAWSTLVSDGMTTIAEFQDDPTWAILTRATGSSGNVPVNRTSGRARSGGKVRVR